MTSITFPEGDIDTGATDGQIVAVRSRELQL